MFVKPAKGEGDDTGSNSVEMICGTGKVLRAFDGYFGEWSAFANCPAGMAIDGMNLQIEPPTEGDDTAMNGAKFTCSPVSGMRSTN